MQGNPLLLGSSGYKVERSLRLRASASAYLSRTPSVTGNRRTWTWSGWEKLGALSSNPVVISAGNSETDYSSLFRRSDNAKLQLNVVVNSVLIINATTNASFRDHSAHYHVVLSVDTTQATNSDGVRLFVNGVLQTLTFSAYTQNAITAFNFPVEHRIGGLVFASYPYDGLLSEVHFIDGQALDASYFGETDPITGVWMPKKYTGDYGTNGFILDFKDNSAATATAIGKDSSGNGNNWTPTNISVTPGSTYDSMLDVPTNWADGGNGRGNYCTLNPNDAASSATFTNGNLTVATTSASGGTSKASIGISFGKWYWEYTCTNTQRADMVGILGEGYSFPSTHFGPSPVGYGYYALNGNKYNNGTGLAYGEGFTNGQTIGIAFDADNGTLTFYKNGVSQGVAFTGMPTTTYFPVHGDGSSSAISSGHYNFGQRPFAYTPPAGFKALNTQNLPDPVIKKPEDYFAVKTFTGTAGDVTLSGMSFTPNLVWLKSRSSVENHRLIDTVRGGDKVLSSNTTDADATIANPVSFFSGGFTSTPSIHTNGQSYVAWAWDEKPICGFDIVSYTGAGANRTIAHNLGDAVKFAIFKERNSATNWYVYHASVGNTSGLVLNGTNATVVSASLWNNTSPTSSEFTLGSSGEINGLNDSYIAYLFAEVAGFSKFGSYTGNGSADGPFVYCGFLPRYVLIKRIDTTSSWVVWDTARNTHNALTSNLYPHLSNAEYTDPSVALDVTSNGFKLRNSNADRNANGGTYIFAAFAEHPMKYSRAR